MTRTKQNESESAVNKVKRKGRNGSHGLREGSRVLPNKDIGEPRLINEGQTLKKEKRNGKGIHDKLMLTQIKSVQKRSGAFSSNSLSHTTKRTIGDREYVEKKTNDDTRELVLPSDSNVVKGNV